MNSTARFGLICLSILLLIPSLGAQNSIVINEIHYRPEVKTEKVRFIELYNAGTNSVDLSGWRFDSGIQYGFPAGTQLAPDTYVVVAHDPNALRAKFGVTSLGPFAGDLSANSDQVVLRNALGEVVDEVEYRLGFPWPTVGDAPDCSMELIHPALDNNLGGSWRSWTITSYSTNTVVTVQGHTNWLNFFTETETWKYEASGQDFGSTWRETGFNDDSWPSGNAVFYRENAALPWPKNTPLDFTNPQQMTFYFRTSFHCATNPAAFTTLQAAALVDDGAVFYLNGKEIYRLGMPTGPVSYGTTATRNVDNATNPEGFAIPASALVEGDNVLAVEVHQANARSSDLVFALRLDALVVTITNTVTNFVVTTNAISHGPTPGRRNAAYATIWPPQLRQVDHSPKAPASAQPVRITAKITARDGMGPVFLHYQLVDPGEYIELSDTAYQTDWTTVPMNDTGLDGDDLANDHIYTTVLPPALQQHRRLVRYRLTAQSNSGPAVTVPYPDDPQPNFAYFVYDGVPAWRGAIQPGSADPVRGQVVEFDTNVMRRLPVYHLIAKRNAVEQATWFERYKGDLYKWAGTLVYAGEVYDHIHYRARGGVWRYSMVKNMWKFDFNRGHDFEAQDNFGRNYNTLWTKLNLGACIQQGDFQHRGEQGLFEAVGFKLFNLAGMEAPHTHWLQFRIIDDALETDPTTQYEGDFWGLYLATEQPDGRFLDEHGLPDGNFYKMEGGSGTLNNQGPNAATDRSDLVQFMNAYRANQTESWWRAHFDLKRYYSFRAIVEAIHHYDIGAGKNYFYYLNPETGVWSIYPWDLDLTWANNMYGDGNSPFKSPVLSRPAFNLEYRNRLREIRDLLFNPEQTGQLIDEYAAIIQEHSGAPSPAAADRARWDYNPKMNSGVYSENLGKAGTGRFYQFPLAGNVPKDFTGAVQLMKNYVNERGALLDSLAADPSIPRTPVVTSLSQSNFPVNRLEFGCSEFTGQGGSFQGVQWRLGEVTPSNRPALVFSDPRKYEISVAWESGLLTSFTPRLTLPPSAAKVGHAYRVRARFLDSTGRWSHWSNPVQFTAGEPDQALALDQHLRLTELMPNPLPGSAYEYLELFNQSSNMTLDLGGVRFHTGITFTFPAGTLLPPGGYLVLTKAPNTDNFAAFRSYYGLGPEVLILGPYSGSLANEGEQIALQTAANGEEIIQFSYGNGRAWPVAANGAGHSLVLGPHAPNAHQHDGSLDYGGHWRASTYRNGSPGRSDPLPPPSVVINEITANTAYADPSQPEFLSNDWIELYNPTDADIAFGPGWYLSDRSEDLKLWAIPPVTIPAKNWISLDEISGFHNPLTNGFGLSEAGDQVFLSYLPGTAEDRVVDCVRFKGQESNAAWGRFPDGGPNWVTLLPSRDQANRKPAAQIVINEIAYAPEMKAPLPDGVGGIVWSELEYIELYNTRRSPLDLFNTNGSWRIDGGIQFTFPPGTTIDWGSYLVLVNFNPTNTALLEKFQAEYDSSNKVVQFLGPYEGQLDNHSDRIALEKPLAADLPGAPPSWVIVDEVIYSNTAPWPNGVAGFHLSLQRLSPNQAGNDPANWGESRPSPGWNWEDKPLILEMISPPANGTVQFLMQGVVGARYTLQASTDLMHWTNLQTETARDGTAYIVVSCDPNAPAQFYRAVQEQ